MRLLLLVSTLMLAACARSGADGPKAATAPPPAVGATTACEVGATTTHGADAAPSVLAEEDVLPAALVGHGSEITEEEIALIRDALRADQAGDLATCIAKQKEALAIRDTPRSRLHLASCEQRAGKLIEALRDAQKSLEIGIRNRDGSVMHISRKRVKALVESVPHVRFVQPEDIEVAHLTFDERPVPSDVRAKNFSVDPGEHSVRLEGRRAGKPFESRCTFRAAEGQEIPVTLR